jgi:phosphate transport system protein
VATTRVHFQAEIEDFRSGLVEMASLVLAQVERGVAAWEDVDRSAAGEVVEGDELVDQRCVELDQKIFNLQLLEAPVASDLRLLHVGLIGVIALERVGDLAVAIANAATSVRPEGADSRIQALIARMSAHAVDVLAQAVQAIARGDVALGERARDDAAGVRTMLDEVVHAVGELPSEDVETRAWAAAAVLVARHLERVANNGAELGGRVRFLVTGEPFTREQTRP